MHDLKKTTEDMSAISEFISGLRLVVSEDEDQSIHEEIHEFYKSRISECLQLDMTDVALAYHAQINKDKRLSEYEKTMLLFETMALFTGGESNA